MKSHIGKLIRFDFAKKWIFIIFFFKKIYHKWFNMIK